MTDRAMIAELVAQLQAAKKIIRTWHSLGAEGPMEENMWKIYDARSPEMRPINEVLKKATPFLPRQIGDEQDIIG